MVTLSRNAGPPLTDILTRRLGGLADLTENERGVLRLIERRPSHVHQADQRLLTEGRDIRMPHFILSGWAGRTRDLPDGRRQIFNFLLPGDAVGLTYSQGAKALTSVVTLTKVRTVEAPEMSVAWRERERVPNLSAALDVAAAEDEYFIYGQIIRLGRQTAYERMAHLFLELEYRLGSRGMSNNGSFSFPLTQDTLADATGLSVVHVNRTLQQMRREGRLELTGGRLRLPDTDALRAAGQFAPPPWPVHAVQATNTPQPSNPSG